MKWSQVVIIGTGRLACACLESCLDQTRHVECLEPEDPTFSNLRSLCARRAVKYQCILDRESLGSFFLKIASPTLVVSAYNSFLFPAAVVASPWLNIVNFHNSLLPRHRGRNAPTWTIFEMDAVTGVTWHRVSAEVDKGEIICQRELQVGADINAILLTQKTLDLGAQAFRDILPSLLDGTYTSRPVEFHEGSTFHRSADMPNHGVLDLSWGLSKAYAFLRSLDYGKAKVLPPARVRLLGRQYSVLDYRAETEDATPLRSAGVEARDDRLVLFDGGTRLTIHLSHDSSHPQT